MEKGLFTTVINGNNIDILKQYPDNHFDAVVTDPPYGLGKEPDAVELMKDWIDYGYHEIKGKGFMGKEWDAFVPQPLFWKEVFRVLKHGGHVLAFYGTRTFDWGVMAMRFAGFEVRDSIYWHYGCLSGDTEILTKSGYIQYHKFIKFPNFQQQEILIYDAEKDIYKWEKPERWNEYNINKDTCYRIKSDYTDQIVSRNHRCLVEREGKLVFIEAELLSKMEHMPTLSDDLSFIQEGYSEILHEKMQRTLSGAGMEKTRKQRERVMVRRNETKLSVISNGGKESRLEGRNHISEKERVLFGSQVEICEMPERIYIYGEEGRVCSRVPLDYGKAVGQTFIENGMRTSHRPQSNEQRYNEFDAFCIEQGTQTIRMGRSYSTTLATITPIEYNGLIFCPTVSTGAFVARRNGKIFLTGNSGFPKSHNISKAIDAMMGVEREVIGQREDILIKQANDLKLGKRKIVDSFDNGSPDRNNGFKNVSADITAPATEEAKLWDGWGTALKPASEPIVMARKPIEKGLSVAENILKWGTGGINIDGCRVTLTNADSKDNGRIINRNVREQEDGWGMQDKNAEIVEVLSSKGRFPANLILSHHPECERKGLKKVKGSSCSPEDVGKGNSQPLFFKRKSSKITISHTDENGMETVEDWVCHEDCPIRILDSQSGITKSGKVKSDKDAYEGESNTTFVRGMSNSMNQHGDSGGASRFFYVAKASKSERNKGLSEEIGERKTPMSGRGQGGLKCKNCSKWKNSGSPCKCEKPDFEEVKFDSKPNFNGHPTVKPVKLMQYLVRLVTPPNGIVLDPFCGSGTTGIACKLEGFNFVGIEQDAEYCKIAEARILNFVEEKEEQPKQEQQHTDENPKQEKPKQGELF